MIRRKKDFLIFIDTNIYLDFYRGRANTYEKSMIKHIDENRNKIITTDQVFMEYKKNRQKVIAETLNSLGKAGVNIRPPAFLSEAQVIKTINKNKKKYR